MAIFYSPVGTREQRLSHQIWPQGWIDAAPYAVKYRVDTPFEAYHSGADLNLNTPTWDLDAHSPVYSMGPGVVTYAKFFSSGWGNLIIVRHESPDGLPLYARYAHVEKIQCSVGQSVTWETQLAQVGRINTESPFHLHLDISRTEILRTEPGHWPKLNRALVLQHYVDPKKFLKDHATEGVPMPEPTGVTLYVQPPGGVRLRTLPSTSAAIMRVVPQNERVEGHEVQQGGNVFWRRVTTANRDGWMGERLGAEIYLAPTPVTPPPIPTGPTPYDGKSALWFWHGEGDGIDDVVAGLPVTAVFVKTSDGPEWMSEHDPHRMSVSGPVDVADWVTTLAKYNMDFHAWCVLRGFNVDGEAQRIIDVANVPGVRSMILDIEPYANFWKGPRENVKAIMQKVRAAIPAGFHIGLSIDPRPQHVAGIYADEWKPFVDSVHPQCYWRTFEQAPATVLQSAYMTWAGFGKPIVPVLQGNAPPDEIELARDMARLVFRAKGLSYWRLGVMDAAQLAAIGDVAEPPIPDPIETLQTTDRINVRSKPSTAGAILDVLEKGVTVKVQGHFQGAGAKDWGELYDPMTGYAARDFMRTPVIVVPPPPKRTYWVWAEPYSWIREAADTSAPKVGKALRGEQMEIEEINLENDGWIWGKSDKGFIALRGLPGEVSGKIKLLDTIQPPPPIVLPPPIGEPNKIMLHWHEGEADANYTFQWVLRFLREDLIGGVHIINHGEGAVNACAETGALILYRSQKDRSDGQPRLSGTQSDYQIGVDFWNGNGYNQRDTTMLHPGVIIQPWGSCEQNADDGWFALGYQNAAWKQRRHVGLFTDSYGTPAKLGYDDVTKKFLPHPIWTTRLNSGCMKFAAEVGNPIVYNGYGRGTEIGKETDDPGSARWIDGTTDDTAWMWYAGQRGKILRDLMPENARPRIILGECGSSAARIATLGGRRINGVDTPGAGGVKELINDIDGYQWRTGRDPLYLGSAYWTLGGWQPGYGFEYSSLDVPAHNILPDLYEWLVKQKSRWTKEPLKLAA